MPLQWTDNAYMVTSLNRTPEHNLQIGVDVSATTSRVPYGTPVFVVTANSPHKEFGIDEDAFAAWVAIEGDELAQHLPDPGGDAPGSALPELVYGALSAGVLVGDPGLELNVHGEGAGYLVRLNNAAGHQQLVGLTGGWHELHWPPKDLTYTEYARYYLQQICGIANTVLAELAPLFTSP